MRNGRQGPGTPGGRQRFTELANPECERRGGAFGERTPALALGVRLPAAAHFPWPRPNSQPPSPAGCWAPPCGGVTGPGVLPGGPGCAGFASGPALFRSPISSPTCWPPRWTSVPAFLRSTSVSIRTFPSGAFPTWTLYQPRYQPRPPTPTTNAPISASRFRIGSVSRSVAGAGGGVAGPAGGLLAQFGLHRGQPPARPRAPSPWN